MLLSIELWNRTKTFSVDIKYMPSIYVCLSFCLCRPCHFFTKLIAFLRVIQNSVYCSSLFLFILLLVHILWTVPKVYCTYWLTLKLCLMLEDYYNLFIKQTHINHCVWKTKYAYIPKGIILHDFVRHSILRKYLL